SASIDRGRSRPGALAPGANLPCSMPQLTFASASAMCQASSPSERAPASGRKSYWPAGSARSNVAVFWASASHTPRNVCNSVVAIAPNLLSCLGQVEASTAQPRRSTLDDPEHAARNLLRGNAPLHGTAHRRNHAAPRSLVGGERSRDELRGFGHPGVDESRLDQRNGDAERP